MNRRRSRASPPSSRRLAPASSSSAASAPITRAGLPSCSHSRRSVPGDLAPRPPRGPSVLVAPPPLRFLGRISYSLYLWHWPILVLPAAVVAGSLPLHVSIVLAGIAVVVAAASERWIERPFRQGPVVRWPTRTTLAAAGAL